MLHENICGLQKREADMLKIKSTGGFTMVELIVVVAIIGVIASMAIPTFAGYRARGKDAAVLSQVRSVASCEDLYHDEHGAYTASLNDLTVYNVVPTAGVTCALSLIDKSGNPDSSAFRLTATHVDGTGKVYVWMSDNGGLQP